MNYKITIIILALIIIVTYALFWKNIFKHQGNVQVNQGMHMMPDGSMMKNDGASMDSMMMDMLANMRGKTGTELEKAFIQDMIPHHQGAVDMAKLLLQDPTIKPELKAFAEKIITAQESEITQMNEWLRNY